MQLKQSRVDRDSAIVNVVATSSPRHTDYSILLNLNTIGQYATLL